MPVPPDWSGNFTTFVNEWKRQSKSGEFPGDEYWGDNPFNNFVVTEKAKSWDHFLRWLDELQGSWCFRGQREAAWLLHSSLDRDVQRERSSRNSRSLYHLDRETETRELLHRFQQYAHHYLPHVPPMNDLSSWYALMQHHCVPTRLLDWTESSYVAMYFAVEDKAIEKRPREKESHSAVWAIDLAWLETRGRELLQSKNSACNVVDHSATVFLCKLYHAASFGQMLMKMMMYPEPMDRPVIRKLEIGSSLRIKFLKHLRSMNIHPASLFPGLDGLGLSLKLDLELKDRDA